MSQGRWRAAMRGQLKLYSGCEFHLLGLCVSFNWVVCVSGQSKVVFASCCAERDV